MRGGLLADVDELGIRARVRQQSGAGEIIVDDHVGALEQLAPPHGQQSRVAGAGPDERHDALAVWFIGRVICACGQRFSRKCPETEVIRPNFMTDATSESSEAPALLTVPPAT